MIKEVFLSKFLLSLQRIREIKFYLNKAPWVNGSGSLG